MNSTLPTIVGAQAQSAWAQAQGEGVLLLDDQATRDAAAKLARAWEPAAQGDTLHLVGDLGAGKTTTVQAFLRQLGVTGRVRSPSFTLAETYDVKLGVDNPRTLRLNHFDCYRFNHPREWLDAGFDEMLAQADLNFIEWPSKIETLLAPPDIQLELTVVSHPILSNQDARHLRATSFTPRGQRWLTLAASM